MPRHLQVVPKAPPGPTVDHRLLLLNHVAERYWHRTAKSNAPRYSNLPDEQQDELRRFVEPIVNATLEIAEQLDTEEDPW